MISLVLNLNSRDVANWLVLLPFEIEKMISFGPAGSTVDVP